MCGATVCHVIYSKSEPVPMNIDRLLLSYAEEFLSSRWNLPCGS